MRVEPFTLSNFPNALLHIDGDAFFASCEQSRNPALKGKPVATGKERGIAASMSYEAKRMGVTRGMRIRDIKKVCPSIILLPSDYETYSLISRRFYEIVRRYTPDIEEYSIDECFADITGLRRLHRMSYPKIAEMIQIALEKDLGFSFSVGLSVNKVMGKVASKWNKPNGLTIIKARDIHEFLKDLPVEKIWGIGPNTSAFLNKHNIYTALQFANKDEEWVKKWVSKPFYEIWQELRGKLVYKLDTEPKSEYKSIQKVKTFTPPSKNRDFVFAQLSKNIENACIKARKFNLAPSRAIVFIRKQAFKDVGIEIKLSRPTALPHEIISAVEPHFDMIFQKNTLYRSTGVTLQKLVEDTTHQMDLFGITASAEGYKKIYAAVDDIRSKYGKHAVYLGSSHLAHAHAQHEGDRGAIAQRKIDLLKGESDRKRLNIPMLY